jgi:hypothetical protein
MEVLLESGEEAAAVSFDGNTLVLRSPKAFAPGSPIRFRTAAADEPRSFEGRTIGSKRVDETLFEVRLRPINLRRADRAFLVERLGA